MMHGNTIAVLLSTYNGERFIVEQLHSLERQSYRQFDLHIRDDGSSDATLQLIQKFKQQTDMTLMVHQAVNVGAMKSFEILLQTAVDSGKYKYFMFCDQDDIWFKNKIEHSYRKILAMKEQYGSSTPLLVYTDMKVVDIEGVELGASFWNYFRLNPKKNRCHDLAMQCNITGCTMMLNRQLALSALPFHNKSTMHDHWIGLVASSLGVVDFIDEATLAYRQHDSNVSGGAPKFNASYVLTKALKYFNEDEFDAVLGRQIDQVEGFLEHCKAKGLGECTQELKAISKLRSSSLLHRMRLIMRYRLFKHGFIRNIGLFFWLIKMSGKVQ